METVAILVDGAFYRKQAPLLFGKKEPEDRADELVKYCNRHLEERGNYNKLYRIFYYDCRPSEKKFIHPLTGNPVDLGKSEMHDWMTRFLGELSNKRKVALRLGETLESEVGYLLKPTVVKKLCKKKMKFSQVKEGDFYLDIKQKGVDMRIGLDIASLAFKRLVSQVVLIAGDSDFVPAAKHARREGIDFVLDPLHRDIRPSLNEHIDGLSCRTGLPGQNQRDKLSVEYLGYDEDGDE
ncbi:MAG: NYN domain-containing protein [Coriobacteriales bacterium]|jgi:uncharacterized LabA/DUF88 family protein|nr:NYN domain-containing protein [Coriobacteriales bacterium]